MWVIDVCRYYRKNLTNEGMNGAVALLEDEVYQWEQVYCAHCGRTTEVGDGEMRDPNAILSAMTTTDQFAEGRLGEGLRDVGGAFHSRIVTPRRDLRPDIDLLLA
jgi:hypothetical protein